MTSNLTYFWFPMELYSSCWRLKKSQAPEQQNPQTIPTWNVKLKEWSGQFLCSALFGGLKKKTCGKTNGQQDLNVSKQLPAKGHCWLLLHILQIFLAQALKFSFQVGSLQCYVVAQGIILVVLFISALFILIIRYWNKKIWFSSVFERLLVMQMRWMNTKCREGCSTSKSLI